MTGSAPSPDVSRRPRPRVDGVALLAAIDSHLEARRPGGWAPIQAQFPSVSEATFFRYVAKAKQVREDELRILSPMSPELREMLGHLKRAHEAYHDIMELRESALRPDGTVRDHRRFERSIALRSAWLPKLLDLTTWLRQQEVELLFDVVIDELKSDKEMTLRILRRLKAIHDERAERPREGDALLKRANAQRHAAAP